MAAESNDLDAISTGASGWPWEKRGDDTEESDSSQERSPKPPPDERFRPRQDSSSDDEGRDREDCKRRRKSIGFEEDKDEDTGDEESGGELYKDVVLMSSLLHGPETKEFQMFGGAPSCAGTDFLSAQGEFEFTCLCCVKECDKKYMVEVRRVGLFGTFLAAGKKCGLCDYLHYKPMKVKLFWGDREDPMTRLALISHTAIERLLETAPQDFFEVDGTIDSNKVDGARERFNSLNRKRNVKLLVHKEDKDVIITGIVM